MDSIDTTIKCANRLLKQKLYYIKNYFGLTKDTETTRLCINRMYAYLKNLEKEKSDTSGNQPK